MASVSAIVLQILYAVAAVLAYILLQKLNDERKKAKRARQQTRLERQKEQQAEVQHRGDSATDIPISSESQRPKESTARSNAAQPPTLPQSVFVPEPKMLDLPSLPSDWEIRPDQLVISKRPDGSPWELGTGAFGKVRQQNEFVACCQALCLLSLRSDRTCELQVFKATLDGVQTVAVKQLLEQNDYQQHKFVNEIAILRSCRNENIVCFLGE